MYLKDSVMHNYLQSVMQCIQPKVFLNKRNCDGKWWFCYMVRKSNIVLFSTCSLLIGKWHLINPSGYFFSSCFCAAAYKLDLFLHDRVPVSLLCKSPWYLYFDLSSETYSSVYREYENKCDTLFPHKFF